MPQPAAALGGSFPASVSELIPGGLVWTLTLLKAHTQGAIGGAEEPVTILECFSDGWYWLCQRMQQFATMAALDMVPAGCWVAAFAMAIGQGEIAAFSFH